MARSLSSIDVSELVAERRFRGAQLEIAALCAVATFVAGFHAATLEALAPPIRGIAGLGEIGLLIGLIGVAQLADRIGRRPIVIGATLWLAATLCIAPAADGTAWIAAVNGAGQIGFGAVLAAAIALTVEFMPRQERVLAATIVVFAGLLGSTLAGFVLRPLALDGIALLASATILWLRLPESPALLARRGAGAAHELRATLRRINRRLDLSDDRAIVSGERDETGAPLSLLFSGRRAPFTLLVWAVMAAGTAVWVLFGDDAWVARAGLNPGAGVLVALGAVPFAAVCGGLAVAAAADRFDRFAILSIAFLIGAVSVAAAVPIVHPQSPAAIAALLAGFFGMGAAFAAPGVVAASYPSAMRATAIGCALAFDGALGTLLRHRPRLGLLVMVAGGLVAALAARFAGRAARHLDAAGAGDARAVERAAQSFHGVHYQRHNSRRLEHLATLNLDLAGKRVLEVGAGVADHTTFFLDRGCNVLSTEPRPENCRIFADAMRGHRAIGYAGAANCTLMMADIDEIDRRVGETFDIVYCYGLLYHLADPERALSLLAKRCDGLLLLETCVSFGDHEAINPVDEDQRSATQAFEGRGCRPTRPWIFNRLKALYGHAYVPRTQPAHEEFPLDWGGVPPERGLTRAVFVASRRPLSNPMLLDALPQRQERC